MQIPERPFDGDTPDDGAPSYEWLDEWLCEYVDGTMDPSLEAVFEQYVDANPELKAHVQRLRQTRELLCGCDAPSSDPRAEVSSEVEEELLESSTVLPESTNERSVVAVGLVSSIAVALVVGFLAGSMLVNPDSLFPAPTVSTVEGPAASQELVREEAPPRRSAHSRPVLRSQTSSFLGDESIFSQPATGPDTINARSTLSTAEER